VDARPVGGHGRVLVEIDHRVHPVDHDGGQLEADAVLEGVGGLHHLIDRGLLGQGD
jgi:hypothetical protein